MCPVESLAKSPKPGRRDPVVALVIKLETHVLMGTPGRDLLDRFDI